MNPALWILTVACFAVGCAQARRLLSHTDDDDVWQPEDGDREEWYRCHGFPCEQWERTQNKVKRLRYMARANGERAKLNDGEVPPDDNPTDDSWDGCVWLTEEQIDGITEEVEHNWKEQEGGNEHKVREKRKLKDFSNYLYGMWDMPIVWKFDGNHVESQRNVIRSAFSHWEDNTCVRFKEIGTSVPYSKGHLLMTRENTGCHSFIGRIGNRPQQINLQDACVYSFGTIVHEIGHALGLWHEQQRADRDSHIEVQEENLGYYTGQFIKQKTVSLGVPYDVGSVMHYDSYSGSKNGKRVMVTHDPWEQNSLGQRTGLSFMDAKIINEAYCGGACTEKLSKPCLHGGYQDPNNCQKCKCPDGFGGDFCSQVAASNRLCGSDIMLKTDGSAEYIATPNYDHGFYNSGDECNWRVRAPDGYNVEMRFVEKFAVYCHYSSQCYHWVEVKHSRESFETGVQGARFCCYSRPKAVITSEDNELVISFRSKWAVSFASARRGFKAQFVAVRDGSVPIKTTTTTTTPKPTTTSTTQAPTTTSTTQAPTTTPRTPKRPSTPPNTKSTASGECKEMDLVFVLDSSGSVMESNWKKVLRFAQDIISHLPIGKDKVRVGLVSYGNSATAHIRLDDFSEEMTLSMAINGIAFKDQWTNTAEGLKVARNILLNSPRGSDVRKVIIMVTDGESNREAQRTIPEAEITRDAGIEIIAMAVGNDANLDEAGEITGNTWNVLVFSDFDEFKYTPTTARLLNHICDDDMMTTPTSSQRIWSCSFDNDDDALCGIKQSSDDFFDWSRWSGSTPSSETGPSKAHNGEYYMYIEASRPRKNGDTARLLLPRMTKDSSVCLKFFYNMHGYHVNSLEVQMLSSRGENSVMWSRSGNNGDIWEEGAVKIDMKKADRLVFVGRVGKEFSGDIAIDQLELFEGDCP